MQIQIIEKGFKCNLLNSQTCALGQGKGKHKSTYYISCPSKILLLEMTMQEQMQRCTSHEVPPMWMLKLQHKLSLQVMRGCFGRNWSSLGQTAHPRDTGTRVRVQSHIVNTWFAIKLWLIQTQKLYCIKFTSNWYGHTSGSVLYTAQVTKL